MEKSVQVSTTGGIAFLVPEMGRFKLSRSMLKQDTSACNGTGMCEHTPEAPCSCIHSGCKRRRTH
jgi:hypothetical protein